MSESKRIKTALVSVYHKEGLDEIITKLYEEGVEFLSTGGTRQFIESLGYPCKAVEDLTTYPSILGGRVKTLHPKIFGGILCRRDLEQDIQQIEKYEIPEIDLVIVDLYPFEATVASGASEADIIEKIDGQEITPENDYSVLLNGKAGKKTLVSLYNPQTKERWEEVVVPVSNGVMSGLLYARWVKQRAADVDKWSNGRLGYVHIESMGDDSFRSVYSDILGKYNNREGIVIDTRFNGGGRLHEDIEILFSGKKYFTQVVRGREACDMPSRRWNKPSIMVQCEDWSSDVCSSDLTMTSVSWETLQDPTLVFGIPVIGYRLPDGSYLENSQLEPDIKVANAPETVVKGEDTQLKAAVDELLREIDGK